MELLATIAIYLIAKSASDEAYRFHRVSEQDPAELRCSYATDDSAAIFPARIPLIVMPKSAAGSGDLLH